LGDEGEGRVDLLKEELVDGDEGGGGDDRP
jgi:hypothetical protein